VFNDWSTSATLANNIFNSGSGEYSYGIFNMGSSTTTLINNDICGADMDCMIFYSFSGACDADTIVDVNDCAWTGCTEASGNISENPLLVNPAGGDFHLQGSSQCIDTGIDPAPTYIPPGFVEFDFEGDARPYGAGWDIGADEWTP
jgi:hypothetical protein